MGTSQFIQTFHDLAIEDGIELWNEFAGTNQPRT